jgi:hypothetical protein
MSASADYTALIASLQYHGPKEFLLAFQSNPLATLYAIVFFLNQLFGILTFVLTSNCLISTLLFLISGANLLVGTHSRMHWFWSGVAWAAKFPIRSFDGLRSLVLTMSILAVVSVLLTSGTIQLDNGSPSLMQWLFNALLG